MITDAELRPDKPDHKWSLPEILKLTIERTPYEPKRYRFAKSAYAEFTEAVAFILELSDDLPVDRATSAALYVGDQQITDLEKLGKRSYRFLVFGKRERLLEKGAPIRLDWPDAPEERREKRETKYYYESPPLLGKIRPSAR
jgi:hypothetical protein